SLILLVRLAGSAWAGRRLLAAARIVDDPLIQRAALTARERLGLQITPAVLASPRVRCPMVWCWRRGPGLLLPEPDLSNPHETELTAIFCHELAHWARGDRWTLLLAHVAICVFPWQPLMWLAASRLRQLSERACDDWALSSGVSATNYADALVEMIPQRRPAMALAAV